MLVYTGLLVELVLSGSFFLGKKKPTEDQGLLLAIFNYHVYRYICIYIELRYA